MAKNKGPNLDEPMANPAENYKLAEVPSILHPVAERNEVADAFADAIQGQEMPPTSGVPIIKINHREEVFSLGGVQMESIEGYPLHWFCTRAWWSKGYNPGSTSPPECWSPDDKRPSPASTSKQCETCAACPHSKFGTAQQGQGKGQDCKTNLFLMLLNPMFGAVPVAAMICPPSSLRPMLGGGRTTGYLTGQAAMFTDPTTHRPAKYTLLVWSRFTLKRGGDLHCVIQPTPVRVCPSIEEARALAEMRKSWLDAFARLSGNVPDYIDVPPEDMS